MQKKGPFRGPVGSYYPDKPEFRPTPSCNAFIWEKPANSKIFTFSNRQILLPQFAVLNHFFGRTVKHDFAHVQN